MKKYINICLLLFLCVEMSFAAEQNETQPTPPPPQGKVNVVQSSQIERLIKKHIAYNQSHFKIEGYRIRIYRDNAFDARQRSQETAEEFSGMYPYVRIYRTYDNPYFKVAVGDFRTKDEALSLFNRIKYVFPTAFIIPENINFPSLRNTVPDTTVVVSSSAALQEVSKR